MNSTLLYAVIEAHARKTHSKHAAQILDGWDEYSQLFWRVLPRGTAASACDFVRGTFYDDSMAIASH